MTLGLAIQVSCGIMWKEMEASWLNMNFFVSLLFSEVQPGAEPGGDQSRAASGSDQPRRYRQLSGGTGELGFLFT